MLTTAAFGRLVHLLRHDRDNLLQKLRKRLRNRLPVDKMLDRSGRASWPINLTFEMTHLCNLSCYMCDLYGTGADLEAMRSENYRRDDLMSEDDYRRVIEEVSAFKPSISLTGGEPMISPMTLPLIRAASKAGLVTTMTTNGYRMTEHAGDLVEAGLRNVTMSLDGVGDVHDAIRGHEGTFANFDRGLAALQAARRDGLPTIQINVTICGRNQEKLTEILDYAADRGVNRVIFSHLWYWDEKMVDAHNARWSSVAPAEVQNLRALEGLCPDRLSAEIGRVKASPLNSSVDVKLLPDIDDDQMKTYYGDSLAMVGGHGHCLAPWMNTRILPNGDVIPCLDSHWGNLREGSFEKAWNSETARSFRRALRERGVLEGCMRCCGLYSYA